MSTKLSIIICALALMFTACSAEKKSATTKEVKINGVEWTLQSVLNREANEMFPIDRGGIATLTISADGKTFSGMGGCNKYSGNVTINALTIKFGEITSTKMECPEGMSIETALFDVLRIVDAYSLKSNELTLTQNGIIMAVFSR